MNTSHIDIKSSLLELIESDNFNIILAHEFLISLKNNGHGPKNVLIICEEIMKENETNELFHNRILEVLDIISGFCNYSLVVWHSNEC